MANNQVTLDIHSLLTLVTKEYPVTVEEIQTQLLEVQEVYEYINSLEFPEKEFYVHLATLYSSFLASENHLLHQNYDVSLKEFLKVQQGFYNLQSSSPDQYALLRYDIDRIISRIDGKIHELRALTALQLNDLTQGEILLAETINRYLTEFNLEQGNNDFPHYINTLGLFYKNSGILSLLQARRDGEKKKYYEAIVNLKKAAFLGFKELEHELISARKELRDIFYSNQEAFSENLYMQGLGEFDKENYEKAKGLYLKAAQVYRSLQKIESRVEWYLQEKIQQTSYYEASGKSLMIKDETELGEKQFHKAIETLNEVINRLDSDQIRATFSPQVEYFKGMSLFCSAVSQYDKMDVQAQSSFLKAKETLEKASIDARDTNNAPLVANCDEALNKIGSYLEIAKLMFLEEEE